MAFMSAAPASDTKKRKRASIGVKDSNGLKASSKKAKLQDAAEQRGDQNSPVSSAKKESKSPARALKAVEILSTPVPKSKERKNKSRDGAERVVPQQTSPGSKNRGKQEKAETPALNGVNGSAKAEKKRKKHRAPLDEPAPTTAEPVKAISVLKNSLKDAITGVNGGQQMQKSGENGIEKPSANWHLSDSTGGRLLRHVPLFSADETSLVVADAHCVRVYETSTSLLSRKFRINDEDSITAFALSPTNEELLYVGTDSGQLLQYHWKTGEETARWPLEHPILDLNVSRDESHLDVVYTIQREASVASTRDADEGALLNAKPKSNPGYVVQALRIQENAQVDVLGTILRISRSLHSLHALSNGQIVVVRTVRGIYVGERSKGKTCNLAYTWHQIPVVDEITCLAARLNGASEEAPTKSKKVALKEPQNVSLEVAIGTVAGKIFVYEDILSTLKAFGKPTEDVANYRPTIFHWHRKAVGSVQFSSDGNYLISGGQETVLLLWQLNSGKRSDLPHLVSPIENIRVSPTGASYALAFADNSVIVLSTSEMKPTTNIAGVQSFAQSQVEKHLGRIPICTRAALDPQAPNHILVAVPSHLSEDGHFRRIPSTPYIQRFDMSIDRHISRQALTRNNATIFMDSPNAELIEEPHVSFVEISQDGNWLATIDEWVPSPRDVGHASHDMHNVEEQQSERREIHLKFWRRNAEDGLWQLETRIDSPHTSDDGCTPRRVLSLVTDPHTTGFATLGEDGYVKVWRPKVRTTEGKIVRGGAAAGTVSWSAKSSIELEHFFARVSEEDDTVEILPTSARLAFSVDGSILAASQVPHGGQVEGLVHLMDVNSGALLQSRAGLYNSDIYGMGFVGHSLIVLSQTLLVWDTVNDDLIYNINLPGNGDFREDEVHLAINRTDNTFAVALPDWRHDSHEIVLSTQILTFDAKAPSNMSSVRAPGGTTAFLAKSNGSGYILLNDRAEIRTLSPLAFGSLGQGLEVDTGPVDAVPDSALTDAVSVARQTQEDEEDMHADANAAPKDLDDDLDEDPENDKPVVRPEELASVFDVGQSFALPPVKDLFKAVAKLYARKPLQQLA